MDSGIRRQERGMAQFNWCMRPRYEIFRQLEMGRTGRDWIAKRYDNV